MLGRILSKTANKALQPFGLELRRSDPRPAFPEATADELALIAKFARYTMTGDQRQWGLVKAVQYVDSAGIPGAIVECGVYRGGAMMLAKAISTGTRRFFLYDTFTGMVEPTEADVRYDGAPAATFHAQASGDWCAASLGEVRRGFAAHGLLDDSLIFVEGRVEDTLLDDANLPGEIALLRLDTDWYKSTLLELEVLYPRLASGGVLILDDYGHWTGARKAVDEYFAGRPVLLCPLDYTGRVAVKR